MTLLDIISEVSEATNVKVFWRGEEVARYDGRNSIPDEFNDNEIDEIFIEDNWLCLSITADYEEIGT